MSNLISYLGKNSYPGVLNSIVNSLKNAECDTLVGNNLVSECYNKLNESTTPILDLKEFTTNAEAMAPDDAKLKDIIAFARKEVRNGDLNFLINIVKEEHYKELTRTGFPSPEQTIKQIEEAFNEPSSVIEQGIKNGLFDSLQSNLLNELKSILSEDSGTKNKIVQPKDRIDITNTLNESVNNFFNDSMYVNNNPSIVKYNPIGIRLEDMKTNKILYLTESDVLTFDKELKTFFNLNESEIEKLTISPGEKRLMTAINGLSYNPENSNFSLNENWDFELLLDKNGKTTINNQIIAKEDIKTLLLESINVYQAQANEMGQSFNKTKFMQDADNFIMLTENSQRLVKLDTLLVVKNLNDNKYGILDMESINQLNESVGTNKTYKIPALIASTNGRKLFESYNDLVLEVSNLIGENVTYLFESSLRFEQHFIMDKQDKIQKLRENQKELNSLIVNVNQLKNIAENNSPAKDKLNQQEVELNESLNKNLELLNLVTQSNFITKEINISEVI